MLVQLIHLNNITIGRNNLQFFIQFFVCVESGNIGNECESRCLFSYNNGHRRVQTSQQFCRC